MIATSKLGQNQQTIRNDISFSGIGLHTGQDSKVIIKSSNINSGVNFFRGDLEGDNKIKGLWRNVTSTTLSTTISNSSKASISTIEHLMSALSGMHIDNVDIYVYGPEIPIMDGSSKPFVELIKKSGIVSQGESRKVIKIIKEVKVSKDDSFVKIFPNNEFSVDFEIEFDSYLINKQAKQLQLINGNYVSDISSARTFGFEKDVKQLRENGLALGGSLDNAVVVGEKSILNKEGLRFKDEFVRHKILDSIGDLYLAGLPVQGYFVGKKSGHYLNVQLLRKLFSDNSNFEVI
tara:strand:+ start:589 stop:1461 length:873 start_codon:yes stop_codon:yes gene_type:complete